MELLLPAGNLEKLKIAVNYGADAVYCSLKQFGARASAGNFDYNELKKGIEYAHKNGTRVYVTFNTLVKDSEIEKFLKDLNHAYNCGCDAIILQDYWLMPLINSIWPTLDIHISTQSFVMNSESLKILKTLGKFSRVVLARELSLDEINNIKKIAQELDIEIEVFGHGALCMCYSGQCLISSIIGGRSGNRGKCAQPCRQIYNEEYLLSTKDLWTIQILDKLISAGVDSLKIEGRMRSENYLKIICSIYRKYIDSINSNKKLNIDNDTKKEIEMAFNRGFTSDYLKNTKNNITKNVINKEKPMNHGVFLGIVDSNGFIKLEYDIEIGDGCSIWLEDKVIGGKIQKITLFNKTNENENDSDSAKFDDIVRLNGIDASKDIGRKIYLTKSQKIERKYEKSSFVNKKNEIKIKREVKKYSDIIIPKINRSKNKNKSKFLINIKSIKECKEISKIIDNKYNFDFVVKIDDKDETLRNIIEYCKENNIKCFVKTKAVADDFQIQNDINKIKKMGIDNILICNIGYLNKLINFKKSNIILNHNLNIFNSFDIEELKNLNLNCIISPELNFDELTQIKDKNFYTLIHGKILLAKTKSKISNNQKEIFIDKTDAEFLVEENQDENSFELYNSKEIGVFEFINNMNDNGIKNFYFENCDDIINVIDKYIKTLNNNFIQYDKNKYTFGHLKRGVY